MELLGEAGIASKEEAESMFKRVDEDGEVSDMRPTHLHYRTDDMTRSFVVVCVEGGRGL